MKPDLTQQTEDERLKRLHRIHNSLAYLITSAACSQSGQGADLYSLCDALKAVEAAIKALQQEPSH